MSGAASFQAVFLQTAVHRAAAKAQSFCRLADIAVVPRERALNQVMLHFIEAHLFEPRTGARSHGAQTKIAGSHPRSCGEQPSPLYVMIHFTNVSRPRMLVENLCRYRIETADGLAITLRIPAQKVVRQQIDVFLALAQRRQMNLNRVEPKK